MSIVKYLSSKNTTMQSAIDFHLIYEYIYKSQKDEYAYVTLFFYL